ncbi:MAG: Ycf66 family protein [Prochlorococcaceae cyanobacterium]
MTTRPLAMLATLGGALALLLGLAVLLLPLLLPELSRSRDAVWGALVLLLGLVLVTSAERLTGAPMLGVLCGGLLIGRLGVEVAQGRWRQLTAEEQQRLASAERWQRAVGEAGSAAGRLLELLNQARTGAGAWLQQRRQPRSSSKRWVRPEPPTPESSTADSASEAEASDDPVVVSSFTEIDRLITASEGKGESEASEGDDPDSDATASGRAG